MSRWIFPLIIAWMVCIIPTGCGGDSENVITAPPDVISTAEENEERLRKEEAERAKFYKE